MFPKLALLVGAVRLFGSDAWRPITAPTVGLHSRFGGPSFSAGSRVIPQTARKCSSPRAACMSTSKPAPKIIIAGAPASGKGTQCELIVGKYGVIHLSTGDILRAAVKEGSALGKAAQGYMDRGELVPDDVIIGVVKDRLGQSDCQKCGWLLDGFPRTKAQADALSSASITPDSFILLDVPDDLLVERVVGRRTDPVTGKIYHLKFNPPPSTEVAERLLQRSDDTEEKIIVRIEAFKKHCDAIVGCYSPQMVRLDGTQDKALVFEKVQQAIDAQIASKAETSKPPSALKSAASLAVLVASDLALKRLFKARGIAFPSSLAGMLALFAALVGLDKSAPKAAATIYGALAPGSQVLAKWLAVFFVPSLIVLPLAAPIAAADSAKLAAVIVGGWAFSAASTAWVVKAISGRSGEVVEDLKEGGGGTPAAAFSENLQQGLAVGAAVSGGVASAVARRGLSPNVVIPATSAFMLLTTLYTYVVGARMPAKVKKVVHPLVVCTGLTLALSSAFARATGTTLHAVLKGYISKSRCPIHLGAGDILLGLLGPSILSFALQMFQRRKLMAQNLKEVLGSTTYAAASGLFGTALAARAVRLSSHLRLATVSRQITSPLAMAIANLLGSDVSLVVTLVVITGVLGANFGAWLFDQLGVRDPVARGLAQGASAHGLGTAAMVNEPSAFAFSAISMALTATISTILVSVPAVRQMLIRLALGA